MSQDKATRETIAKQISIEFGIAYSTVYKKIDKILQIWSNEMIISDLSISNIELFKIKKKNERIGKNPKKVNSDMGNPDNCKLDTIDEGPGTDVTLILFAIQYCTKLYPGSEISGDPASEIRTQFLFFNKTLI